MNIKMIKAFKYSSAQLLLKYQSKYFVENNLYENMLYFEILKIEFKNFLKKKFIINDRKLVVNIIMSVKKIQSREKIIKLNNMRNLTVGKRIEMSENII